MLKIIPKQLAFIPKLHEFYGHMGLKMVYKIKARKDIIYSRISVLYILALLRFEGVKCPRKESAGCVVLQFLTTNF
jgi:hypothetical protein